MRSFCNYLIAALLLFAAPAFAAEKEDPYSQAIKDAVLNFVSKEKAARGSFEIYDPKTAGFRTLEIENFGSQIRKNGDYYFICVDMKDARSGELLDVDFDIIAQKGSLRIVDMRIHKDGGKPRYLYDEQEHIIPAV